MATKAQSVSFNLPVVNLANAITNKKWFVLKVPDDSPVVGLLTRTLWERIWLKKGYAADSSDLGLSAGVLPYAIEFRGEKFWLRRPLLDTDMMPSEHASLGACRAWGWRFKASSGRTFSLLSGRQTD